MEFWQQDVYLPKVADRDAYKTWLGKGKPTSYEHAKELKEKLLAQRVDKKLTQEQEEAIEEILQRAREYYRANGSITDAEWELYMEDLNSPNYPYA